MSTFNYHHLRYFHAVATDGQLGRTADRLNVSQSALSMQIKQLEARLGTPLFDRVGRRLELTEAGRVALDHAARIFAIGDELIAALAQTGAEASPLKIGAVSTLSRNFQMQFIAPLLEDPVVPVRLTSGDFAGLLAALGDLQLDVVLSTELPPAPFDGLAARRITDQVVGLHGVPALLDHPDLDGLLATAPLILPSDPVIRGGFQDLLANRGITPNIIAEADDMAMLRLLARSGAGVALAPAVVLADEIANGRIATAPFDLDLVEPFYAITRPRKFTHPALGRVLR